MGFPNTRKLMKARVFEIASQSYTLTKNNEKIHTDQWHRTWNINYFFGYCFSVIIGLCCQILAVSKVPEDRHCLKRNTYISFDLSSVILNEICERCHVLGKPKQPKKRLIWFETRYQSLARFLIYSHL